MLPLRTRARAILSLSTSPYCSIASSSSSSSSLASIVSRLPATSPRPSHRTMSSSVPAPTPSTLASSTCVPCRGGVPSLSADESKSKLSQLHPDWSTSSFPLPSLPGSVTSDHPASGILQRHFAFRNFRTAIAFANRVGQMAEEQKHHPALVVEWGRVSVGWWTHAIGGLHENDFICAAKTDELADGAEGLKINKASS